MLEGNGRWDGKGRRGRALGDGGLYIADFALVPTQALHIRIVVLRDCAS